MAACTRPRDPFFTQQRAFPNLTDKGTFVAPLRSSNGFIAGIAASCPLRRKNAMGQTCSIVLGTTKLCRDYECGREPSAVIGEMEEFKAGGGPIFEDEMFVRIHQNPV